MIVLKRILACDFETMIGPDTTSSFIPVKSPREASC